MKSYNAYQLKWLAIIGMTMNHIVYAFASVMPLWLMLILNVGGGLTFPIMAFFLVEGIRHTSNIKKYMLRLFIFALIAQVPFVLVFQTNWYDLNILFTLLLSLFTIYLRERFQTFIPFFAALLLATFAPFTMDWGVTGLVVIYLYYLVDDEKKRRILPSVFAAIAIFITNISRIWYYYNFYNAYEYAPWQAVLGQHPLSVGLLTFSLGSLAAIYFIRKYSYEIGKRQKYFFYIYYPAHLAVLAFLHYLVNSLDY